MKTTELAKAQSELRALLDTLIKLEDQRTNITRNIKRWQKQQNELDEITTDAVRKLRVLVRVEKSAALARKIRSAQSERFSLNIRIHLLEKYIITNFR